MKKNEIPPTRGRDSMGLLNPRGVLRACSTPLRSVPQRPSGHPSGWVNPFYIFAPHTVSYLVKRPPVRYSYTVRERHHIIIPVKPVLSGLTFRLQMRCENVECHSSCLSCEQYGNSDKSEFPYCSRLRREECYRLSQCSSNCSWHIKKKKISW